MNIHNPVRYPEETQQQYRERRAQSAAHSRLIAAQGMNGGTSSRQSFRDTMRRNGTMGKRTRAYVALMAAWASKRVTKTKRNDEHGSYTEVGQPRRMWLAGVSAQRGY